MNIKFDPKNVVIKLCMRGISLEESGNAEDANTTFQKAWYEATDDYERFIAAYHLSLRQKSIIDKLGWLETSLKCAININDDNVKSAFQTLYLSIAKCYDEMNDIDNAKRNYELSASYMTTPSDKGPFFHGTKANLQVGDFLTAGRNSNYKSELKMNHIYFTANVNGAGLAAALAKGEGKEHVYIVEPTGAFENHPNVTDKKFPGNLTRSYRSLEPIKIIDEATEWLKLTNAERDEWFENLTKRKGMIIN